jgi:hypothetical protein
MTKEKWIGKGKNEKCTHCQFFQQGEKKSRSSVTKVSLSPQQHIEDTLVST